MSNNRARHQTKRKDNPLTKIIKLFSNPDVFSVTAQAAKLPKAERPPRTFARPKPRMVEPDGIEPTT